MDKKEKSINSHIDKAIGYSDKAHNELQIALDIALDGKGLSNEEKRLLSVDFATGQEEAVERVTDGSCNDEITARDHRNKRFTIPRNNIDLSWEDEPIKVKLVFEKIGE